MIEFLLQEIERSPNPLFTKKELISISPKEFDNLIKKKIITYFNPCEDDMEILKSLRCKHGCPLYVSEVDGELEAVCLEHPEEDPIPIENDDLNRYAFSIDMLLVQLRTANKIDGELHRINGGYFYIGYKTYSNNRVGFIFVLNISQESMVKLSGLKRICADDNILVVLTPVSKIDNVTLKQSLRSDGIVQIPLAGSFNPDTFELPIERLISKLLKPKAEEDVSVTELSEKQRKDYDEFEYQCYDKIHIPGNTPMKRSNIIIVNGSELKLGDSLLALMLRFVLELKKREDGWVDIYTLESEGIITSALNYQACSNLRTALEGSLLAKDGQKFIQSDGSKRYRISTHPDFITYNRKKLSNHQHPTIKRLGEELP